MRWIFLCFLTWSSISSAVEIYSFVQESCQTKSGLILQVGEETISLLQLDGRLTTVNRSELKSIVIFNTLENPFQEIVLDEFSRDRLKTIFLDNDRTPYLTGWPVKFIEDLVLFFDLKGGLFVID